MKEAQEVVMVYGHLITTETHQYYQYSPPQFSKKFSTTRMNSYLIVAKLPCGEMTSCYCYPTTSAVTCLLSHCLDFKKLQTSMLHP